jgi:hypothetical protein
VKFSLVTCSVNTGPNVAPFGGHTIDTSGAPLDGFAWGAALVVSGW